MLNNSTFIYLCKTVKDLVRIIKTIVSFFSNDFFKKNRYCQIFVTGKTNVFCDIVINFTL